MPKRPLRKSERERFVKEATQLLLTLGAKQDEGESYPFTLQTKVGCLRLLVTENSTQGPGTVFTRFDDPEVARELVDCNPASGKWNHFFFDGSVDEAIEKLAYWLKKVMP